MNELVSRGVERYEREGLYGLLRNSINFIRRAARLHLLGIHLVTKHLIGVQSRAQLRQAHSVWEYFESATTEVLSPRMDNEQLPARLERQLGVYSHPRPFVVEIEDVRLLGRKAIPIGEEGVVLEAFSSRQERLERHLRSTPEDLALLVRDSAGSSVRTERTIDLACSFASVGYGYCEWIQSVLTRLPGLERYESATGRTPTIILPENPPSWMVESIEYFGYDNWIEWDRQPTLVESFVVPSVQTGEYVGSSYLAQLQHDDSLRVVHPDACQWLRERAIEHLEVPQPERPNRVYVSREMAGRRMVLNRDELDRLLEKHGFETQTMETLAFSEQVRIMSDAEIVLGPHGAGLVNSIFAEDSLVVELFGKTTKATYFLLSASCGHDYRFVTCDPNADGMYADVEAIERILP